MSEVKVKTLYLNKTNDINTNRIDAKTFFQKCLGKGRCTIATPSVKYICISFIASFLGILTIAYAAFETQFFALFPPLGASAVLLYGAPAAPFSQPRNLLGGHLLAALVAVIVHNLLGVNFVSIALTVSLAIAIMLLTRTIHPPAGATAFIGVIESNGNLLWPFVPVLISVVVLLLIALIINNLDSDRSYPEYWY